MANTPPTNYIDFVPDQEFNDTFLSGTVLTSLLNDPMLCLPEQQSLCPWTPVSPVGRPLTSPTIDQWGFEATVLLSAETPINVFFSKHLNRIYVKPNTGFCMKFDWDYQRFNEPMYVRGTMVFSDVIQALNRVEPCVTHYHNEREAGKSEAEAKSVLLSSRSGTEGVYYCGLPDRPDSWFSVVVELPTHSPDGWRHSYMCLCSNSCATGIHGRITDIIFTLEDKNANVFGRQVVGLRVCASPSRDMRTDYNRWLEGLPLKSQGQRRKPQGQRRKPQGQRRKSQGQRRKPQSQRRRNITQSQDISSAVVTTKACLLVLRSLMSQLEVRKTANPNYDDCMTSIKNIGEYLDNLGEPSQT